MQAQFRRLYFQIDRYRHEKRYMNREPRAPRTTSAARTTMLPRTRAPRMTRAPRSTWVPRETMRQWMIRASTRATRATLEPHATSTTNAPETTKAPQKRTRVTRPRANQGQDRCERAMNRDRSELPQQLGISATLLSVKFSHRLIGSILHVACLPDVLGIGARPTQTIRNMGMPRLRIEFDKLFTIPNLLSILPL